MPDGFLTSKEIHCNPVLNGGIFGGTYFDTPMRYPQMLTDQKIKALKPKEKQYKVSDEKGLYLLIKPNAGKYWRLKYRLSGKEKNLAIGVYPDVSLKNARLARDEAKKLIHLGIDPTQDKQEQKLKRLELSNNSYEVVVREWIEKKRTEWSKEHSEKVLRSFEQDVFPSLGRKPINEITPPILLLALRKIESRGALEVAQRALQRCGAVFAYGIAAGICERNPANDLKGALTTPKKENYKALSKKELPAFLSDLEKYEGHITTQLGLKLLIHTFVRTNELRGAKWGEFDFDAKQWIIPGDRMKMKAEHIVPLSKQAVEILEQLKLINGRYDFVLPGIKDPKKTISANTLIYAIYRMGYHSRATAHGFRATASTILNEMGYNHD
ncbi:MAG: integrase arm-type DNA-binding domain-containing protein, partial [Thiotrichaceae bacterium]|nr:integrase arm-type DNA-binding domain-containing protein [Thiotrichaceae bacterium]